MVDGIFTTMVRVNLSYGTKKATWLSTFSSGMCFGEIDFLTGQPRTADVIALLRALCSELGGKLASASGQLALLEHNSMEVS